MKKTFSILLAALMLMTVFPIIGAVGSIKAAGEVKNAVFVATKWSPNGYTWNGSSGFTASQERLFTESSPVCGWGRPDYQMPAACILWSEFYLDVIPDGGNSTESNRWFVVMDGEGNLWFDKDGRFNDSRYYKYADPDDPTYGKDATKSIDSCKINPKSRFDPTTANNTQGPYPLQYGNVSGASSPYTTFNPIYFMDPETSRVFRIGWADFIAHARTTYVGNSWINPVNGTITVPSGSTAPSEWDTGMPLERFLDGYMYGNNLAPGVQLNEPPWQTTPPNLNLPNNAYNTGNYFYSAAAASSGQWNPFVTYAANDIVDFQFWGMFRSLQPGNLNHQPIFSANWWLWWTNYFPPPSDLGNWNFGEEWHAINAALPSGTFTRQDPSTNTNQNMRQYFFGDNIYRKGLNGPSNQVAGYNFNDVNQTRYMHAFGATRLTPVITTSTTGRVVRYAAGSAVRDAGIPGSRDANIGDDYDVGVSVYRFPLSLYNFTNHAAGVTPPMQLHDPTTTTGFGITVGDTVHLRSTWGRDGMFDYNTNVTPNGSLGFGEGIYEKNDNNSNALLASVVEADTVLNRGDIRLTDWGNFYQYAFSTNGPAGYINPGDAIILSEVLSGGCSAPTYNISVETDLWMGSLPSKAYAALRSPNAEFTFSAQDIQKSTVLGPTGSKFTVPATTFQNVQLKYREYLGVEIWLDNGVDNNIGTDGIHFCIPNNASDDYWPGATGEVFLGAQSGEADTDIGLGFDTNFYRVTDQVVLPLSDFWQQNNDPNLGPANPGFGAPVRFFDTNSALPNGRGGGYGQVNYYGCGEALYRDTDYMLDAALDPLGGLGAFEISAGDIRLSDVQVVRTDSTGSQTIIKYYEGSTVSKGDADVNLNPNLSGWTDDFNKPMITTGNDLSGFYDKYFDQYYPVAYQFFMQMNSFSIYEPVYLDWKHLDPKDSKSFIPLNYKYDVGEFIYDAGASFDLQGSYWNPVNPAPALWGDAPSNPNGTGSVSEGFIRLTNVDYNGKFYMCGSQCSIYDYWEFSYPVQGITYGNNGDRRFMDMEVIPSANAGAMMTLSKPFKVEQTSEVVITMDPPPEAGHWDKDGQTWIPDEKCYVLFQGVGYYQINGDSRNLNNVLFECNPQRPEVRFHFTPYRGSCPPDGRPDRPGDQYAYATTYVLRESGGKIPAPPDGYYGDFFWDWQGYTPNFPTLGQRFVDSIPGQFVPWRQDQGFYPDGQIPYPPLPAELENNYDCMNIFYNTVEPEELSIDSDRLCITTIDQRFPNLTLKLTDKDNPDDVNDPAGIPFSIPYDFNTDPQRMGQFNANIVNYNCTGGGIAWMAVAVPGDTEIQIGQISETISYLTNVYEKYIIQYHNDGTYYYWYWYEPSYNVNPDPRHPQIPWALDENDYLLGEPYTGTFPIPNSTRIKKTPVFVDNRVQLEDTDCSSGDAICDVCNTIGLRRIGDVSGVIGYPLRSDYLGIFDGTFGYIVQYGVPTYVSGYGQLTDSDLGGECLVAVKPRDGSTHLEIRVYSNRTIFDYNSSIAHPKLTNGGPFFVYDKMIEGSFHAGIDYCGIKDLKVYPPDPYVNFAEFTIVDRALQFSKVHYTNGTSSGGYLGPLSPLNYPTPQIQAPYDPILKYVASEFRTYPGGQTHAGRHAGQIWGGRGGPFGWNAYPAIWSKRNKEGLQYEQFGKLGTEFFPLTDYGFFFIMKDGEGRHLSFNPDWDVDRRVVRMEVTGPFARPKIINRNLGTYVTQYEYNGLKQVPISYDWSGRIVIDNTNWQEFEMIYVNQDFNGEAGIEPYTAYRGIPNENDQYRDPNPLMTKNRRLNFASIGQGTITGPGMVENTDNLMVIDEIIPWQPGKLLIYVTLADGTFKMYQDCCTAPPTDGVDVHALGMSFTISEDETIDKMPLGVDTKVEIHVTEKLPFQTEAPNLSSQECNDAVVYLWQDRGVKHLNQDLTFGSGDAWVTNPPGSTRFYYGRSDGTGSQYDLTWDDQVVDVNGDGMVKFKDWETEIMGEYNTATNTWSSGIIDARTFQRNNGTYMFEVNTPTSGLDFGGEEGIGDPPDHIISDNELLPVYVTAYKYGDDNSDRSFSPFWDPSPLQDTYDADSPTTNRMRYSHEVYVAGQVAIPVEPVDDLIVTMASPKVLTAGITPELISSDTPLTFDIKNAEGNPVDLTKGILDPLKGEDKVKEEHVWNFLFKDPYPDDKYYYGQRATLPQYYFVRTNLHNRDLERENNEELFSVRTISINDCRDTISIPFRPIKTDFSQAALGKYIFRGFCANDVTTWKGEPGEPDEEEWIKNHQFIVYIYTPDRKHRGKIVIPIDSPKVSYEIVNVEDKTQSYYTSPGDPDFVMTAADNRIYKIRATVTDAEGRLVKGVTKGVSVCGGGVKNTARFTPFVTRPVSFDLEFNPCEITPCASKIYPRIGFDWDASEKKDGMEFALDPGNKEIYKLGGFVLNTDLSYQKCKERVESGYIEYNTTCYWWHDNNEWETQYVNPRDPTIKGWAINKKLPPNLEFLFGAMEPLARGWGLGNIYNYPWFGGALFADIDANGNLDYHDALGLDVNAQTEFYIFAEDACFVGGLVGDNTYVNNRNEADVAGYPPRFTTDPRETYRRFRFTVSNDQTFYLDWEAWPSHIAAISSPRIKLIDASSTDREEVGKSFLNQNNYDLIYNVENHMICEVRPADDRDIAMHPGGEVVMVGNQHEHSIYGKTSPSANDSNVMETTIEFMPTGLGEATARMYYLSKNKYFLAGDMTPKYKIIFNDPEWYGVLVQKLDVGKGLKIEAYTIETLTPKATGKIYISVKEIGTLAPISGAKVKVSGLGVDATKITNNKGEVEIDVVPNATGFLKIEASQDNYKDGWTRIVVGVDRTPPMLIVDPVSPITNKSEIQVTGTTSQGSTVIINGKTATTQADGSFKGMVKLSQGKNAITVIATNGSGNQTSKIVWITQDTEPPAIMVDKLGDIINKEMITLKGRVDPDSKVTIMDSAGGKLTDATVVHDIWEAKDLKLASAPSKTIFTILAVDAAGNESRTQVEITNIMSTTVEINVGQIKAMVNGTAKDLPGAPFNTAPIMAPADMFKVDFIGGDFTFNFGNNNFEIKINGHTLNGTVKSLDCTLDGNAKKLASAPELKNNVVFLPVVDVAQKLGCIVVVDTNKVTITYNKLP